MGTESYTQIASPALFAGGRSNPIDIFIRGASRLINTCPKSKKDRNNFLGTYRQGVRREIENVMCTQSPTTMGSARKTHTAITARANT